MRAERAWRVALAGGVAAVLWTSGAWAQAAGTPSPGVATGGSAGATSSLPGPASQPGTGEPPASGTLGREDAAPPQDGLILKQPPAGATAGAGGKGGRITEAQVRQALEQAGYTGIVVNREGDDLVARGMLNGAAKRLRIDPATGRTTEW